MRHIPDSLLLVVDRRGKGIPTSKYVAIQGPIAFRTSSCTQWIIFLSGITEHRKYMIPSLKFSLRASKFLRSRSTSLRPSFRTSRSPTSPNFKLPPILSLNIILGTRSASLWSKHISRNLGKTLNSILSPVKCLPVLST